MLEVRTRSSAELVPGVPGPKKQTACAFGNPPGPPGKRPLGGSSDVSWGVSYRQLAPPLTFLGHRTEGRSLGKQQKASRSALHASGGTGTPVAATKQERHRPKCRARCLPHLWSKPCV